jgi:phosphoribosylaminoimidazole-succinocarboxamide synthase
VERCDPYKDDIPQIPAELIEQTSDVYIQAYKMITGKRFVRDMNPQPLDAIREALKVYF